MNRRQFLLGSTAVAAVLSVAPVLTDTTIPIVTTPGLSMYLFDVDAWRTIVDTERIWLKKYTQEVAYGAAKGGFSPVG